jgi:hypothetical protein
MPLPFPGMDPFLEHPDFFPDLPRVERQVRPEFSLICPGYPSRPADKPPTTFEYPLGPENDNFSRASSRTHFRTKLSREGIELFDQSRSGLEVNFSVVRERELVPARDAGDITHIDVGVTGTVDKQFRLEMLMLAPERRDSLEELTFWDELYCELAGGRLPHIQTATRSGNSTAPALKTSTNRLILSSTVRIGESCSRHRNNLRCQAA